MPAICVGIHPAHCCLQLSTSLLLTLSIVSRTYFDFFFLQKKNKKFLNKVTWESWVNVSEVKHPCTLRWLYFFKSSPGDVFPIAFQRAWKGGRERERNINAREKETLTGRLLYAPNWGRKGTHNPGECPLDWELNMQPFGSGADALTT